MKYYILSHWNRWLESSSSIYWKVVVLWVKYDVFTKEMLYKIRKDTRIWRNELGIDSPKNIEMEMGVELKEVSGIGIELP